MSSAITAETLCLERAMDRRRARMRRFRVRSSAHRPMLREIVRVIGINATMAGGKWTEARLIFRTAEDVT